MTCVSQRLRDFESFAQVIQTNDEKTIENACTNRSKQRTAKPWAAQFWKRHVSQKLLQVLLCVLPSNPGCPAIRRLERSARAAGHEIQPWSGPIDLDNLYFWGYAVTSSSCGTCGTAMVLDTSEDLQTCFFLMFATNKVKFQATDSRWAASVLQLERTDSETWVRQLTTTFCTFRNWKCGAQQSSAANLRQLRPLELGFGMV